MDHDLAMMRYLLRQPPHVLSGLELDPKPGVAYHISPNNNIEAFTPRKIQRTMTNEDELVPRICTGVGLLDCIRGYAVMARDFMKNRATCAGDDSWLGGYCIYALPYQCSVFPKRSMAPMAEWCRERWLVPYLEKDQVYPHQRVGKMFIHTVKLDDGDRVFNVEGEVFIHVEAEGLPWDHHLELRQGYHRATMPFMDSYFGGHFKPDQVQVEPLDQARYEAMKQRRASLLSYEANTYKGVRRW